MTTKMSSGLRSRLLGVESFSGILGGGCIKVFTGTQPASADQPEQGTLLGLITVDGHPWSDADTSYGTRWDRLNTFMGIPVSDAWRLAAVASGTAGWFRIVGGSPDGGAASQTAPRIDGSIGTTAAPGDMIWGDLDLVAGKSYPITDVFFVLPPLSS